MHIGGQNQLSFKRASKILERIYGIKLSTTNVRKVTEFVGKVVYEDIMKRSKNIWDTRIKLDTNNNKKSGILYIESDGATINTRATDAIDSTWKENKLGIFFNTKDIYTPIATKNNKQPANKIQHKEYVSYLGDVDTFRMLFFAKAVELKYWNYEKIIFISDGAR